MSRLMPAINRLCSGQTPYFNHLEAFVNGRPCTARLPASTGRVEQGQHEQQSGQRLGVFDLSVGD